MTEWTVYYNYNGLREHIVFNGPDDLIEAAKQIPSVLTMCSIGQPEAKVVGLVAEGA